MSKPGSVLLGPAPAIPARPAMILLAGDEPHNLAPLAAGLWRAGYRTVTVAALDIAAILLRTFRFALVIADAGQAPATGDEARRRQATLNQVRVLATPGRFLAVTSRCACRAPRRTDSVLPPPSALADVLATVATLYPLPASDGTLHEAGDEAWSLLRSASC